MVSFSGTYVSAEARFRSFKKKLYVLGIRAKITLRVSFPLELPTGNAGLFRFCYMDMKVLLAGLFRVHIDKRGDSHTGVRIRAGSLAA